MNLENELLDLLNKYKMNFAEKLAPYGTAGYRMESTKLHGYTFRITILAILRSLMKKKCVGLMITASHNPEKDNGIKVVEPNGDMLAKEWEYLAEEIISWKNDQFYQHLRKMSEQFDIDYLHLNRSKVFIGYDTRQSSPELCEIIQTCIKLFQCDYLTFQHVTTPQLHFFVKAHNSNSDLSTNHALLNEYFTRFSSAYIRDKPSNGVESPTKLFIDCANGVGAIQLKTMALKLAPWLNIQLVNTTIGSNLNYQCGADYVKINQTCPKIYDCDDIQVQPGEHWCSIDGDADRLIYFYMDERGFHLLDGDKISVLIADYLAAELLGKYQQIQPGNPLSVCIVQTAYANSASTQYIKQRYPDIDVVCVPTGVKYLHAAAKQYDIGIYFEANGHGTVLFSERSREAARDHMPELDQLIAMVNDADGDAICDALLIEYILASRGHWTLPKWDSLYTDYPSRQMKVSVKNRSSIVTKDAERIVSQPVQLQEAIDKSVLELTSLGMHARSFVRPSGTEDIVRVYAESESQQEADQLAQTIVNFIQEIL